MDLSNSTPIAATLVNTTEAEAETETPTRIQPTKPSPFSNGVLKRHALLHLHHGSFNSHHPVVVTYKECLKNHAASLGGHAVDGCGDFMPSLTSNSADPTSLKCAACGCHRNFHRREPEEPTLPPPTATPALEYQPHHRHHPLPPVPANRRNSSSSPNNSPSPPPISSSYYPSAPHMLLALSHGLSGPPPDSNTPIPITINTSSQPLSSSPNGRKRFRTKFTQDQKGKMLEFTERLGWKMQKRDEDLIAEFCSEIGVDKSVFKVWMHNNKYSFGRKEHHQLTNNTAISTSPSATTNNGNSNGIGYGSIGDTSTTPTSAAVHYNHHHHESNNDIQHNNINGQDLSQHHLHDNSGSSAHVLGTNGSSSS